MDDEAKYKEELAKAGVDLPELKDTPKPEADKPKDEEPKPETPKEEPKADEPKEPLQEEQPKEQRKRSIYDEYKDRKAELREETAKREQVEKERDELARKLEEATAGKGTAEDKEDAAEDAIAYAEKIGASPDLVKRIIADARKGFESKSDPEVMKRLEAFENWQKSNAKSIETQMFNDEFEKTTPSLKKLFPSVTDDELKTIKTELDKLSHTKEWHDKSLGYVAFENQDKLSALVSPKKRGMEGKGRKDVEAADFEFDPNADLSKMSPKERTAWEKQYREMSKSDGLITDAQGKKMLV